MIDCVSNFPRPVVVEIRKGDFVLRSDRMSQNDLTKIIELVPILIKIGKITIQWLKFRPAWYRNIQRLTRKERLQIEQVVIIFIYNIR